MAENLQPAWQGHTDGTPGMHRALIASLRILPLWFVYLGASLFVVPVYMVTRRKGYLAQYHFFRQRLHYGVLRSVAHVYRNHCLFAQAVIDRFYLFSGGRFRLDIDHYDLYNQLASAPEGFVILSAHVGCYEVAGAHLNASTKPFNAVVFAGESETIQASRRHTLSQNHIHIIPMSSDMSHVFAISAALERGEIVSIAGDRVFGSPRTVTCRFFDAEAPFPLGPFALAAQRSLPVLLICVMKDGLKHYQVNITRLDEGIAEGPIRERAKVLAQRYASALEGVVRKYPNQWYNYFEFWKP